MAMFFAQRVILDKSNFEDTKGQPKFIPDTLKPLVAEILIESGLPRWYRTSTSRHR